MSENKKTVKNIDKPKTHSNKEIAIIGSGPAGVFCALQLIEEFQKTGENAYHITIFDPLETLSTILPTGNGRCNLADRKSVV